MFVRCSAVRQFFPLHDAQFMHRSPCQRNRRKRELKASLIIEKKQIGVLWECIKDGADL